jgi:hypothetical protein
MTALIIILIFFAAIGWYIWWELKKVKKKNAFLEKNLEDENNKLD